MKYSLYLLSWVSTEQAVGCSVKHRKAHTVPSSTTLMPGSGCCGTAWPWPPHLPPAATEKGSLLRRGAGEAAPTSRCPEDQVFCSAANQNCPLANPPQTLSPRPSPQLSCRAHGGRRQSSLLIYFRLVSLGRLHEKPLGVAVLGGPGAMPLGSLGIPQQRRPWDPAAGRGWMRMRILALECSGLPCANARAQQGRLQSSCVPRPPAPRWQTSLWRRLHRGTL